MKKIAFTLAETLIVMGIIGVVAALTLPNLNSSTGDKEKVAKVKKIYSNLSDAVGRMQAVYGKYDEWSGGDPAERLEDFLKISKKCTSNSPTNNCFNRNIKCLSGTSCTPSANDIQMDCWGNDNGTYILADGSSIYVYNGCSCQINHRSNLCILVDIDGPNKGSSQYGKDVFQFGLNTETRELDTKNFDYLSNYYDVSTDNLLKENCFKKGHACADWVVRNDNLDYLKANEGKCNNSNIQLSWSNITCK